MAPGTDLGSHLSVDQILECLLQQPTEQVFGAVITETCKHIPKR
jgi:hypothetical protein